jgi:hypothetical protein
MVRSLVERLWASIERRDQNECWPWTAGKSKSGRRNVYYGHLTQGRRRQYGGRHWRAHRLVLILKTAPVDVPQDPGEEFLVWLTRADRFYKGLDAAHTCDYSLCCNPEHLAWESHQENVERQKARQRTAQRAGRQVA